MQEVTIEIKGGLIQKVTKPDNVRVSVIDYDNDPDGNDRTEWRKK
jgi:hypothetical protein